MTIPYMLKEAKQSIADWMGLSGSASPFAKASARTFLENTQKRSGIELFEVIYESLELRWKRRSRTHLPSKENWRLTKKKFINSKNPSPEVRLEKWIANSTGGDWVNGIPTASGLFNNGGRKANIDLAKLGEDYITFVELKWDSNHWWYAAIELAGYAAAWVQALNRAEEMGYITKGNLRPALAKQCINWVVLAPAEFYQGIQSEQMLEIQAMLDAGISFFTEAKCPGIEANFRFVHLPASPDFRGEHRPSKGFFKDLEQRLI